ncbi:MAG: bifunctional DNA-formamidopyrimidine glycosylase/DNA-(apurinic or apyrimidinic site) lyase [archaeon]|nr:bifunctional DNA-formamidopyrimidine glycosylase/DNA-(apurinic or apyrimidinic site) lyase [Nanoarchaeota archaeon]
MPELPEVETIRKGLEKKLVGRTIYQVKKFDQMENISQDIVNQSGAKINKVLRRSKYLIIELSNNNSILIHLRMSGQLVFKNEISSATRVEFNLSHQQNLLFNDFRKFGTMEIVPSNKLAKYFLDKGLGPEPLDNEFTFEKFNKILQTKARSKVKNVLMDQRVIAGLGNIYAQEVCFYAKVNPERKVETLNNEELKDLHIGIKQILTKAIKLKGTSFDAAYVTSDGESGQFSDFLKIYHQQKCKECNSKLNLIKMNSRSTYYCPKCQK